MYDLVVKTVFGVIFKTVSVLLYSQVFDLKKIHKGGFLQNGDGVQQV